MSDTSPMTPQRRKQLLQASRLGRTVLFGNTHHGHDGRFAPADETAGSQPGAPLAPGGTNYSNWGDSKAVRELLDGKSSHALHFNIQGGNEDTMLSALVKESGRGEKPRVTDAAGIDKLKADGWTTAYRGVSHSKFNDLFRDGEFYAGSGLAGNGVYFAPASNHVGYNADETKAIKDAQSYAQTPTGSVIRIAIPPTARMIDEKDLVAEQAQATSDLMADDAINSRDELIRMRAVYRDLGRFAALKNYDGIRFGGGVVVLNRSILVAQKENAWDAQSQNSPGKPA